MAFVIPVMKNNYDIYKDTRSRKSSECSNSSTSNALGTPAHGSSAQQQRRRKVSECKSESFATSPSHGQIGQHRMQMQRCQSSRAFPRNASRSSHSSMMSPTRSYAAGMCSNANGGVGSTSPTSRAQTSTALEKQQQQQQQQKSTEAANDYSKFHLRLVDKLRKSFRKDSSKRS